MRLLQGLNRILGRWCLGLSGAGGHSPDLGLVVMLPVASPDGGFPGGLVLVLGLGYSPGIWALEPAPLTPPPWEKLPVEPVPVDPSDALDPVVLQLKWKHQFQFAGYYVAQQQGFYEAAGLDISIVEAPDDGSPPVQRVLQGQADFGVATSDLLLLRSAGQPVVALAAIFQHSPSPGVFVPTGIGDWLGA